VEDRGKQVRGIDDLRTRIIGHAIGTDVAFVERLIGSHLADPPLGPVTWLCTAPFLSLVVHESHLKVKRLAPDTAIGRAEFTHDVADIVARSRHTLKLFEDTARPDVEGHLEWFHDHVTAKHRTRFVDGIKVRALRWLGDDLGIFLYGRRPIANTHAAAFFLGIDSDVLLGPPEVAGRKIRSTTSEYGRYFGLLGARLKEGQTSFATHAHDVTAQRDVRSERYYATTYNGRRTPKLNALLCAFQALLNTTAVLLPLDTDPASTQTIVKLQYLTLYHVLQSLRKLTKPNGPPLTTASRDHIEKILGHPAADRLFTGDSRPLRNSLMHYDVDTRIDLGKLSPDHALYNLPKACLSLSTKDFIGELGRILAFSADTMDSWSSSRR
jgi:hypothetical protein